MVRPIGFHGRFHGGYHGRLHGRAATVEGDGQGARVAPGPGVASAPARRDAAEPTARTEHGHVDFRRYDQSAPATRAGRPYGAQGAPARRVVFRRLRRRRHHACRSSARSCARLSTCAAGQQVLDVAAGNGNAALAAARRWCDVVAASTTCRRCSSARASAPRAERLAIELREADAEALPFADGSFDVVVSTFGVMFTPDQERAARELRPRLPPRRQDRARQLDAGRLHRPAVQDASASTCRRPPARARRRSGARARASPSCSSRMPPTSGSQQRSFVVPLSLGGPLAGGLQDLLRAAAQGLRRARRVGAGGARARDQDADRPAQPLGRRRDGRAERVPRDRHHARVTSRGRSAARAARRGPCPRPRRARAGCAAACRRAVPRSRRRRRARA